MYDMIMDELDQLLDEYETVTDDMRRMQIEDRCKEIQSYLDSEMF